MKYTNIYIETYKGYKIFNTCGVYTFHDDVIFTTLQECKSFIDLVED